MYSVLNDELAGFLFTMADALPSPNPTLGIGGARNWANLLIWRRLPTGMRFAHPLAGPAGKARPEELR